MSDADIRAFFCRVSLAFVSSVLEVPMISGKILKSHGWPEGKIIGLAKAAAESLRSARDWSRTPSWFGWMASATSLGDTWAIRMFAELARECLRRAKPASPRGRDSRASEPLAIRSLGRRPDRPRGAVAQMENALRLPVAVAGALMPDAHVGYGLPIGGVLATDEAVIPYAVGVDIACRMRLSVYEVSPIVLGQRSSDFQQALLERTRFGMREGWERTRPPRSSRAGRPRLGGDAAAQVAADQGAATSLAHLARATTSSSGASSASTPTTSSLA